MANQNRFTTNDTLASLPLPMPSVGIQFSTTADEIAELAESALETEKSWGIACNSKSIATEFSIASLGSIQITTGRTRPVALQYKNGDRTTIEMCYAGRSRLIEGITEIQTEGGEILAFPNRGAVLCGSDHSGISFSLDKARIKNTARAIYGNNLAEELERPAKFAQGKLQKGGMGSELLFSLFRMINDLLSESQYVSDCMNLDDQIYRAFVITLAKTNSSRSARSKNRKIWAKNALDDLVDYIGANIDMNLTMTNLEEHSHYSARQLQYLFREKFDCTPMQFVRRQRLATAMEKLQTADWDDTVTSIGRNCGYRFTSNFSSDFHREFGVAPSVVLRASRSPGHKV